MVINRGNRDANCRIERIPSACADAEFQFNEALLSLSAYDAEARLEVSFCPTTDLGCHGQLLVSCATADDLMCDLGRGETGSAPVALEGFARSPDEDGDGYTIADDDCNDHEPEAHPGATEQENRLDDDCDEIVDEETALADDDGDGFSEWAGDCDDANPTINPGSTEVADGRDQDCNGRIDDHCDLDGDGITEEEGDCDNSDPSSYPGAPEGWIPDQEGLAGDARDNDCDGAVDEGTTWHDDDGDGACESVAACNNPSGGYASYADCDDNLNAGGSGYAWSSEGPHGLPECDDDGDGYSEVQGDCDDNNARRRPEGIEIRLNGIDDDCSSLTAD